MQVVRTEDQDLRRYLHGCGTTAFVDAWFHSHEFCDDFVGYVHRYSPAEAFVREDFWPEIPTSEKACMQLIQPAPVFMSQAVPSLILYHADDCERYALLMQVSRNQRVNFGTLLFDASFPPFSVSRLFDLAVEGHRCEDSSVCIAYIHDRRYEWRHDVEIQSGLFVRLMEWFDDQGEEDCSTEKKGHGGVEIWLMRVHPKSGQPIFHAGDIRVLVAGPEKLIVRTKYKGVDLLLPYWA